MNELIKVRREGEVEIIEFCNPPMNFISNRMLKEFHAELWRVRKDPAVRVLVLTGGMKDSFITHYDVAELLRFARLGDRTRGSFTAARVMSWFTGRMTAHPWLENMVAKALEKRPPEEAGIFYWSRCLELLDTTPQPVIAAISGMCLGGGVEISLCCDFRFMARGENYRIGLPEVLVGIIPGGTGTPLRLPRVVGEARALEMILTGELYTPEEAEAMGLINKALPAEDLMPRAMALAHKLGRGAPAAQAMAKDDIRRGSRTSYPDSRAIDLFASLQAIYSRDADAGMERYVEITGKYDSLQIKKVLEDVADLREGREVKYKGK